MTVDFTPGSAPEKPTDSGRYSSELSLDLHDLGVKTNSGQEREMLNAEVRNSLVRYFQKPLVVSLPEVNDGTFLAALEASLKNYFDNTHFFENSATLAGALAYVLQNEILAIPHFDALVGKVQGVLNVEVAAGKNGKLAIHIVPDQEFKASMEELVKDAPTPPEAPATSPEDTAKLNSLVSRINTTMKPTIYANLRASSISLAEIGDVLGQAFDTTVNIYQLWAPDKENPVRSMFDGQDAAGVWYQQFSPQIKARVVESLEADVYAAFAGAGFSNVDVLKRMANQAQYKDLKLTITYVSNALAITFPKPDDFKAAYDKEAANRSLTPEEKDRVKAVRSQLPGIFGLITGFLFSDEEWVKISNPEEQHWGSYFIGAFASLSGNQNLGWMAERWNGLIDSAKGTRFEKTVASFEAQVKKWIPKAPAAPAEAAARAVAWGGQLLLERVGGAGQNFYKIAESAGVQVTDAVQGAFTLKVPQGAEVALGEALSGVKKGGTALAGAVQKLGEGEYALPGTIPKGTVLPLGIEIMRTR